MRRRYVAEVGAIGVAAVTYVLFARPWHLRWGASTQEWCVPARRRPHRERRSDRDPCHHRPRSVYRSGSWIAQLGQGRGGLQLRLPREPGLLRYSARIGSSPDGRTSRSGTRSISPGDRARRCRAGAGEIAGSARRDSMGNTPPPYDFTWAWVLVRNRTGHRGCSCARDTPTPGRGPGSSSSSSRRSASS